MAERLKTTAVILLFVLCFGIAGCLDRQTALEHEDRVTPVWER